MKEQISAVEWLENEFQEICKDFGGLHSDFIVKFEQAKAMEKEQIRDAFNSGMNNSVDYFIPFLETNDESENYYNEIFKSE